LKLTAGESAQKSANTRGGFSHKKVQKSVVAVLTYASSYSRLIIKSSSATCFSAFVNASFYYAGQASERDFSLQNGNFVCKEGVLFANRDSYHANGILALQLTNIFFLT
jgi:hypothetical protein